MRYTIPRGRGKWKQNLIKPADYLASAKEKRPAFAECLFRPAGIIKKLRSRKKPIHARPPDTDVGAERLSQRINREILSNEESWQIPFDRL
jgi:hypothetical protein